MWWCNPLASDWKHQCAALCALKPIYYTSGACSSLFLCAVRVSAAGLRSSIFNWEPFLIDTYKSSFQSTYLKHVIISISIGCFYSLCIIGLFFVYINLRFEFCFKLYFSTLLASINWLNNKAPTWTPDKQTNYLTRPKYLASSIVLSDQSYCSKSFSFTNLVSDTDIESRPAQFAIFFDGINISMPLKSRSRFFTVYNILHYKKKYNSIAFCRKFKVFNLIFTRYNFRHENVFKYTYTFDSLRTFQLTRYH